MIVDTKNVSTIIFYVKIKEKEMKDNGKAKRWKKQKSQ